MISENKGCFSRKRPQKNGRPHYRMKPSVEYHESYYLAHAGAAVLAFEHLVALAFKHLAHLHPLGHATFAFEHLAAVTALAFEHATTFAIGHLAHLHPLGHAALAFEHLAAVTALAFGHLAHLHPLGHAAFAFLHAESLALLHAFSSFIVLHPTNSPAARIAINTFFILSSSCYWVIYKLLRNIRKKLFY